MVNRFNFVERFAPLSSLQATIIEIDSDKFLIAPEGMISCNVQDDHAVVWYKNDGEDAPRFAQMGEFVTYRQVMTALLPIDLPIGLPWGTPIPEDLLAVLEVAPEEVLVAFATWAGELHEDRYPSTKEVWQWLNASWREERHHDRLPSIRELWVA